MSGLACRFLIILGPKKERRDHHQLPAQSLVHCTDRVSWSSIDQSAAFVFSLLPHLRIDGCLDGFIARNYRLQTTLGSKLDSLGDFVFWSIVLFLYIKTKIYPDWIIYGIVLVASIRFLNLILTKVKFAQWGMLHTLSNKITGLALFLLCFVAFTFGDVSGYIWVVTFLLALFSSIEETLIVWRSTYYEPNPKGFFTVSHQSS